MSEEIIQNIKQISNEQPVKKGKRTWKPASLNEFQHKQDGYVYRMIRKDPDNMAKKAAEGWEACSGIQSGKTKHVDSGRMNDGKSITSVQEGKDWILARIPEESALERQEYYQKETDKRVAGLTAHMKKEIGKEGAETHGNITISSRQGTQVIE